MKDLRLRKVVTYVEEIATEHGEQAGASVRRAWAAAVFTNPCDGLDALEPLAEIGAQLGGSLGQRALEALGAKASDPLAYGKGAVVGTSGSLEHAAAVMHPKLGAPLRKLIQQGKAIIPSAAKRGGPGARIDIPLHGADNEWDFLLLDAIEAAVPDAPLPNEIIVFVALSQGGRPAARIGRQK